MDWNNKGRVEGLKRRKCAFANSSDSVLNNHIMVLLILTGSSMIIPSVLGMCPEKCVCDDTNLIVTCIRASLEVMPNTLNPRLQTIIYRFNDFPSVDVSLM